MIEQWLANHPRFAGTAIIRRYQGRYEKWADGAWVAVGAEDDIAPPPAKPDYNHHIREVQGLCKALSSGQFVLLEQDGTWHLGNSVIGRYAKTVFPKGKSRRLW